MYNILLKKGQLILTCLILFICCDVVEAERPDPARIQLYIQQLGVQDTTYQWETMFKKGSDQWDVDINHIYAERQYHFVEFLIRIGHGNSWKFYIGSCVLDPVENPGHEIINLSLNPMWKGKSSTPKLENSVKSGYPNYISYEANPWSDTQKKITPYALAVRKYIADTMTFYPEKIIWTEKNQYRPLLDNYDYFKYGIPGNWQLKKE